MQTKRTQVNDTQIKLEIIVDEAMLVEAKEHAINKLAKNVKVPGFRAGKAPMAMIEKSLDPAVLQEEFLNDVLNQAYSQVIIDEKLQPIAQPKVEVTKFVPFSTVEFTAIIEQVTLKKLADYKKLTAKKTIEKVAPEKITEVIENMRQQMAQRKDVERAAKNDDQLWIDFDGKDKDGKEIKGAKSTNYPIVLGSNTFIPGFEEHLMGMKAGDTKTFDITFPKDYGVKALQGKKATFDVVVVKVQEVIKPELDEEFVKKVSPESKNLAELKKDIESQLAVEADSNAQRAYENALVAELVEKSDVVVPDELLQEQEQNVMRDLQQNLLYRGQTMQEYLDAIGMTEKEQKEKEITPEAERRLKAGIILSEIAEKENLSVSAEEIDIRISVLKQRYASDAQMQKELENPNNRREIGAQLLTEKTIAKIVGYQK